MTIQLLDSEKMLICLQSQLNVFLLTPFNKKIHLVFSLILM